MSPKEPPFRPAPLEIIPHTESYNMGDIHYIGGQQLLEHEKSLDPFYIVSYNLMAKTIKIFLHLDIFFAMNTWTFCGINMGRLSDKSCLT